MTGDHLNAASATAPSAAENENTGFLWPVCPECGLRRQASCPTCNLGSDQFPLAEFIPAAETLPIKSSCCRGGCQTPEVNPDDFGLLLMCPDCEEAFAPRYYRYCERCGYDYGDGLQVTVAERERLSSRANWVLAMMIVLGLLLLGYFWFLFQ